MKGRTLLTSRSFLSTLALLLALTVGIWIGCGEQTQAPTGVQQTQEIVLSPSDPQVQAVMQIQNRYTEELMERPGIVGTATGMTEDGKPAVIVYAQSEQLAKSAAIPAVLQEAPVIVRYVGEIKALKGPPNGGGGVDPTARFERPVPIGVSTGHPAITAGTIGCRVTDGSDVFALSNNHVYADENTASLGDAVIQPGTYDGGSSPADDIGTLDDFAQIDFSPTANNVIDAAIAITTTALVDNSTPTNGYGTPKIDTIVAAPGMRVMKYGRTTGQTKGRIDSINGTFQIGYSTGTARFVRQIAIIPGSFSAGGDSGSLIVVEKGQDARRPVGLLFAGSTLITIANPIDDVLDRFGVTIDGEANN